MAKLPRAAVEALAVGAWGTARGTHVIRKAVEIARLESDFETTAHNATPPDDSYGLWQINMIGSMGAERRQKYGLRSNAELFNPATNARVAFLVWKDAGESFSPWTTEDEADAILDEGARDSPLELVPGVGEVAGGITDLVKVLLSPNFWKRVGLGALGLLLVLIGVALYNQKSITQAAVTAVTKGKGLS